jgi:hypothetical protein
MIRERTRHRGISRDREAAELLLTPTTVEPPLRGEKALERLRAGRMA